MFLVLRLIVIKFRPFLTETHFWLLSEGEKLYFESNYFFSANSKIHNRTYKLLKEVCEKLKIPYGENVENGFILRYLRYSFSSHLHKNLIDNKTIIEFTDNPSAVERYQHSTEIQKQDAMAIIENTFGLHRTNENNLGEILDAVKSGTLAFEDLEKAVKNDDLLPKNCPNCPSS